MVRVVFFDNQHNFQGAVEFGEVPITDEDQYTCLPDGFLPHETIAAIAHELDRGAISGWIERYHWYRQAQNAGEEGRTD
jgi:hypothetical protein